MLSSYPVACPHQSCGWKGNLIPSPPPGRGVRGDRVDAARLVSLPPVPTRLGGADHRGRGNGSAGRRARQLTQASLYGPSSRAAGTQGRSTFPGRAGTGAGDQSDRSPGTDRVAGRAG
jgi:hypothetical protein